MSFCQDFTGFIRVSGLECAGLESGFAGISAERRCKEGLRV